MSEAGSDGRLHKDFPVFDCDAHVNDPPEIWSEYVPAADRDAVRAFYWHDEQQTIVNGRSLVLGGASGDFRPLFNPILMAGPQMNKAIIRKLLMDVVVGRLGPEQMAEVEHRGAVDGTARLHDMDLMGIDQVMVIPSMVVMHLPFAERIDGARAFARAYNTWALDYCAPAPDRLFPAAWLPLQSPHDTVQEIHWAAEHGFRMGLVRPIDARHGYPNRIGPGGVLGGAGIGTGWDDVYRAFEETGMVLGMHTFPAPTVRDYYDGEPLDYMVSPGELNVLATDPSTGQRVESQALTFILEAQAWLVQVLLSGFLDRFPRLRMAILESNSSWLRSVLAHCDRLFRLYANERRHRGSRLPSEAFFEQCTIAFESDETPTFRQWDFYEDVTIWSSDAYHTDGADVWSAIREMDDAGVPPEVHAKMLGGNARRLYRIDPRTYVRDEPPPIVRPSWFPHGEELETFVKLSRDPRRTMPELAAFLANGQGTSPDATRTPATGAY